MSSPNRLEYRVQAYGIAVYSVGFDNGGMMMEIACGFVLSAGGI